MSYMCDSGNLMAIAQQVIQQKQKQEQQKTQQISPTTSHLHPFSHPWLTGSHHPDPYFPDPFDVDNNPVTFRLPAVTAEFESDDWMETLTDTWHDQTAFPPEPSDLNGVVFSTAVDDKHIVSAPFKVENPDQDQDQETTTTTSVRDTLKDCAKIVDSNPDLALKYLTRIRELVSDHGDPTQRSSFYFWEALNVRINCRKTTANLTNFFLEDYTFCYKSLNEACPYLKFAHLTANQAILEATESSDRIHIIDFGIIHGIQWAALLQALATRPAGKPAGIRISGVATGDSRENSLSATAVRLKYFANLLDLDLEFDTILTPIDEIVKATFRTEENESLAINFMLDLFNDVLDESPNLIEKILRISKNLNPRIVTVGEYETGLNRVGFLTRFETALDYYLAMFESIEAGMDHEPFDRIRVEKLLFGNRIRKIVGPDFKERDNLALIMELCGFEVVPLSSYAVSQAKLLLWNYNYSAKFSLMDSGSSFMSLAWQERPLVTVSSWR